MLVRRSDHEVVLQCENCDAVFYADTGDLTEARLMAEADGWKCGLDDDHNVEDFCPKCLKL